MMTTPRVRKQRKKSPSPSGIKKPGNSVSQKKRWEDPAYREKMRLMNVRLAEERKLNPMKFKRTRVPDGMRKAQAKPLWAKAEALADRFIKMAEDEGVLPALTIPGSDDAMATAALRAAFVIALAPGEQKTQLAAQRLVLEWTRAKPESKSKLTVEKAEDWLEAAKADMARDDGE